MSGEMPKCKLMTLHSMVHDHVARGRGLAISGWPYTI